MTDDPKCHGGPQPAEPEFIGKCIVCGCDNDKACDLEGQPCGWINLKGTICSGCVPPGIAICIQNLHQVAQGALAASQQQIADNDERGALRSQALGGLMLGCGEVLARCGAETAIDARMTAGIPTETEDEPENMYGDLVDELNTFMIRFGEIAELLAPPEPTSGLVDARGRAVSSLAGLAKPD